MLCFFVFFCSGDATKPQGFNLPGKPLRLRLFWHQNYLPLQPEDLNGPSFNPVSALVAKLLTVWARTSERGRTYSKPDPLPTRASPDVRVWSLMHTLWCSWNALSSVWGFYLSAEYIAHVKL